MENKEKKFIDELKNQKFTLDSSEVWSNIEDKLPKREGRRLGALWLLMGIAIVTISLASWYILSEDDPEIQHVHHVNENKIEHPKQKNENAVPRDEITSSAEDRIKTDLITNNNPSKNNNVSNSNSSITRASIKTDNINTQITAENHPISIAENVVRENEQNDSFYNKEEKGNTEVAIGIRSKITAIDQVAQDTEKSRNDYAEIAQAIGLGITSIENQIPTLFYDRSIVMDQEPSLGKITPVIVDCCSQKHGLIIRLGGNIANVHNTYQDLSSNALAAIKDKESGRISYSGSIFYERGLKRGWSILAGLQLDQQVVRFRSTYVDKYTSKVSGIQEIHIDSKGLESNVLGDIDQVTLTERDIQWHRYHTLLDASLLMRNVLLNYKGTYLSVEGGLSYNLGALHQGYAFDLVDQLSIVKDNAESYTSNFGIRPQLGLGIGRRVGKLILELNANYKGQIRPINISNINYSTKNSQTGLQLGIRYNLNGN